MGEGKFLREILPRVHAGPLKAFSLATKIPKVIKEKYGHG
jgi:hypothetical protein